MRFGSEGQSERYKSHGVNIWNEREELTASSPARRCTRLNTLAYPGQQRIIHYIHAMNAFLSALDDKEFELTILKKNSTNL